MSTLFRKLPSLTLFFFGLIVITGWIIKFTPFVQFDSDFSPVTFNSGLCFIITGVTLYLYSHSLFKTLQILLGGVLALFVSLSIIENIFNINLGIDEFFVQSWLKFYKETPGRMALNTSITFFITGILFVLLQYTQNRKIAIVVEILIYSILLIGLIGLTGYLFEAELLYSWSNYTLMSLPSAICFVLLALGLWYSWRNDPHSIAWYQGHEDLKIILLTSEIIFSLALIVGLTSYLSALEIQTFKNKLNLLKIVPFVIAALGLGALLLRVGVMPLIRRLITTEEKLLKLNEKLQETQERYDLAMYGSQVGLWDWVVGTDEVYYSSYFKKMLGYEDHEWPNTKTMFDKVLHPDDYERVYDAVAQHIEKKIPFNIEYRLLTKSGVYHWYQAVGKVFWNELGIPDRMAGSLIDVTERKKTQSLQSVQYLITRLLAEASTIQEVAPKLIRTMCEGLNWDCGCMWMINSQSQRLNCMGIWSNPTLDLLEFIKVTTKLELKPEQGLPGKVWTSGKSHYIHELQEAKDFSRKKEAENVGLHSAFLLPIQFGFKMVGVIEFYSREKQFNDELMLKMMESLAPQIAQFIQRKSLENELRDSEAHKSAILASAPDSIITVDDQGKIMSWNPQSEIMFGFAPNELNQKSIDELVPDLSNQLSGIENKGPIERTAIQKLGDELAVELTISGMIVNEEHRYVIIIRDISERKKIESLKNEFVSVVSHELRTPLTSIRGSLGLILGGAVGEFSEKIKDLLEIANNNCDRLLLLINDILDIEKIEANRITIEFETIDLNELLRQAIKINQPFAEKYSVKLELQEKARGVKVSGDPERLMQVITNLISNAVKFSPPRERVMIVISTREKQAQVSVHDNGEGIPEEFQSRVFQKFSQADTSSSRAKGGTGLGLSITKAIIEKLGGTIHFESNKNSGTTFYFDLPLWQGESKVFPVDEKLTENILHQKKLLICEDDVSQAEYLQSLLESANYSVHVSHSVFGAKKMLAQHKYDGLLLDLLLPDQDGISFVRELRKNPNTYNLPIIVVSIISETGKSLLKGEAISVVDWIEKPIDFNKLLKSIERIKKVDKKTMPSILHVEDDQAMQDLVAEVLREHAEVIGAKTLRAALDQLAKRQFDLTILDLILPDGNGVELLPFLGKKKIPVIVLSSMKLDPGYAQYVLQSFVKSETSDQQLLDLVKKAIRK